MNLDGKVALVTGSGRGIGRAEVTALAEAGCRVIVNDIGASLEGSGSDQRPAEVVVEEIRSAGGTAIADHTDITKAADVEAMIAKAVETYGQLDILVNNAGVLTPNHIFPDTPLPMLEATIRTHVLGYFYTSVAATRHWRDVARGQGAPVDARIINTASESYLSGAPWHADYTAAKSAVVGLTLGSAPTCIEFGVRINAICPRAFTRMSDGFLQPDPLNAAENVAKVVVALCSAAGSSINGQVLIAGSGQVSVLTGPTVAQRFEDPGDWTADSVAVMLEEYFDRSKVSYAPPLGELDHLLGPMRDAYAFLN